MAVMWCLYTLCLLSSISGARAKEWYISRHGNNTKTCGNSQNEACATLDYVIPLTQSGDRILLMPDQSGMAIHNYCTEQPITHDLTIEGTAPNINLTCGQETSLQNIVFVFENVNVTFRNIGFSNSSILGLNSHIEFRDSRFDNGQIYLMDHETIAHYSQQNFTLKNLDEKLKIIAEKKITNKSLQCSSVSLKLHNVQWSNENNDDMADIYLDSLLNDGIQVICDRIAIEITDSTLADKHLFVYAISHLEFRFIRTTLEGSEDGRKVQGGIKLNSFVSPSLFVENSSISSLLFSDFFYAIFSAQQYTTAAVYLRVVPSEAIKTPDPTQECVIRNSVFSDNFRAINIVPDPSLHYSCHVTGSNFTTNHVLTDGGAVLITGDEESDFTLTFTGCYFEGNAAGSRELDFSEEFPIRIHQEPGIIITNFEETEEDSLKIYMELLYGAGSADPAEPVDEVVFLDISGSGGAVFVGTGSVYARDCLFMNNTAVMYGGAIHVVTNGLLNVTDSVFYSPPEDQELEDGTLMSSFAKSFVLDNVEMNQVSPYASEASVFFHEKDGYIDTAGVVNITINCPINAQINAHNVSLEILKGASGDDTSPYLTYKELWYDCLSCESDTYSLSGGFFGYHAYPKVGTLVPEEYPFEQKITYDQIECHECSFGGSCSGGNIYPKVHHWGIANDGAVQFYNCPSSYCCGKPVCDDGDYAVCAKNRAGTLCGRCSTDYSEAMFSSKCIQNKDCNATWMFPVTCVLAFIYAMFLLFQNDLKDFLVGQPRQQAPGIKQLRPPKVVEAMAYHNDVQLEESETGETRMSINLNKDHAIISTLDNTIVVAPSTGNGVRKENDTTKTNEANGKTHPMKNGTSLNSHVEIVAPVSLNNELSQNQPQSQNINRKQDEGGIFLILLFYYFQDSSIVFIRATYANVENALMLTLKDIAGSLFKFRIDLSIFVSNVCIMPDVTPVLKIVLKLVFQPALFSILILIAIFAHGLKQCSSRPRTQQFGIVLSTKTASGMVFAILFSYQTVASSMFSLVHCVNVNGTEVLFVDGNITCYESWQTFTLIAVAVCLIPFSFYLTLAPGTLLKGRISVVSFFIASFCSPVVSPFLYFLHKFQDRRRSTRGLGGSPTGSTSGNPSKEVSISPEARAVYRILQGPYREYSIKLRRTKIYLCWSGILLARRLMLILCDTFIYDLLLRLILMTAVSMLSLFHHVSVRPCKENRANIAGTVSGAALSTVCVLNLIKATMEAVEYTPVGPVLNIVKGLSLLEDALLFWIPLVGASIMILVLVLRVMVIVGRKITRRSEG